MVLFPAIFLAILQFIFTTLTPDTGIIDDNITTLYNASMWTSPDDPKYDTFFGNDPIGWFADNTYVFALKVVALFTVVLVFIFPFADMDLPIAITGVLATIFSFLYGMIGIGGYKILSPFVGR